MGHGPDFALIKSKHVVMHGRQNTCPERILGFICIKVKDGTYRREVQQPFQYREQFRLDGWGSSCLMQDASSAANNCKRVLEHPNMVGTVLSGKSN